MRVASGIQQEFVKIKESREFDRDAMLLGTCYSFVAVHLVLCALVESSPTPVAARHFLMPFVSSCDHQRSARVRSRSEC
jgi:hypothetical protein